MRRVAHQPRRQVRHDLVALGGEALGQREGGLEAPARRGRDGDHHVAGNRFEHSVLGALRRQDLVSRLMQQRDYLLQTGAGQAKPGRAHRAAPGAAVTAASNVARVLARVP